MKTGDTVPIYSLDTGGLLTFEGDAKIIAVKKWDSTGRVATCAVKFISDRFVATRQAFQVGQKQGRKTRIRKSVGSNTGQTAQKAIGR